MMRRMSWQNGLPAEIGAQVLGFLPLCNAMRMRETCKTWKVEWFPLSVREFRTDVVLGLDFGPAFRPDINEVLLEKVAMFFAREKRREEMHLMSCSLAGANYLTDEGFLEFLKICTFPQAEGGPSSIKSLNISGCGELTENVLLTASQWLRNLTHLDISGCSNKMGAQGLALLAFYATKLETLIADGTNSVEDGLYGVANFCPNLKRLSLENGQRVTHLGIVEIANKCRLLQSINLNNVTQLVDSSIFEIARNCPELRELHLQDCDLLSDSVLFHLGRHCANLMVLNVRGVSRITDNGISNFVEQARERGGLPLRSFNIKGCSRVSTKSMMLLIEAFPGLTSLGIGQTKIDSEGVGLLIESDLAPKLEVLDLTWLKNTSFLVFSSLAERCHNLQELYLKKCTNIDAKFLGNLSRNCPHLRVLAIPGIENVNDTALVELAQLQGNEENILKELEGWYLNPNYQVNDFAPTLTGPPLEEIDIFQCQNVSVLGLLALFIRFGRTLKVINVPQAIMETAVSPFLEFYCPKAKVLNAGRCD